MQHLPLGPQRRRRLLVLVFKALLTVTVLAWLLHDVDLAGTGKVLVGAALPWLLLGMAANTASLVLHELRTWQALPAPRPPKRDVVLCCLALGNLSALLPARAGDVAIIAALARRHGVRTTAAAAVVGVTSIIELAAFALVLAVVLATGAARTHLILGPASALQAVAVLGGTLVLAAAGSAAVAWLGGLLEGRPSRSGFLGLVQGTIRDASTFLRGRGAAINAGLAVLQILLLCAAFTAALISLDLGVRTPFTAATTVLAVSSLVGLVLPSSWGAGPAAGSALVLDAYGVPPEGAAAFALAYWATSHLPLLLTGIPALWWYQGLDAPLPEAAPQGAAPQEAAPQEPRPPEA